MTDIDTSIERVDGDRQDKMVSGIDFDLKPKKNRRSKTQLLHFSHLALHCEFAKVLHEHLERDVVRED